MAFDCMAIGVGLFASVMATWEPNERFTYGSVFPTDSIDIPVAQFLDVAMAE